MKRRDFVKKSLVAGIAAGAVFSAGSYANIVSSRKSLSEKKTYDMVAIKGGEPDEMFERAIKSLGGIKNFVKPNQKVLIKPNIGWDVVPEKAANTNPKLVYKIIKMCKEAGAKDVFVFDHTCDAWKKSYENSGIEKAVKDAGGKIVQGNNESNYQEVEVKKGKRLKKDKVHELVLDSDVFINVPILKDHGSARLTMSMKNLMGTVWDRGFWHRNDLHQCIADYSTYCKPTLNVIDAYKVMHQNGPRGVSLSDLTLMKSMIISTDIVAADTAAAKLLGLTPEDVPYIKIASEMNLGKTDLQKLSIDRIIL